MRADVLRSNRGGTSALFRSLQECALVEKSPHVNRKNPFNVFTDLGDDEGVNTTIFREVKTSLTIRGRRRRRRKQLRDWAALNSDLLSVIFTKLGVIHLLHSAQFVCSSWRHLSEQPHLYRSIDVRSFKSYCRISKLAREVVDRSGGNLVEFATAWVSMSTCELLKYIASKPNAIKSFAVAYCDGGSRHYDDMIFSVVTQFPHLEELEFSNYYSHDDWEIWALDNFIWVSDKSALAIAKNMPKLRRLSLCRAGMSNKGLEAILDGCPYLEYLDIRGCSYIDLTSELRNKFAERIKTVRLPHDSLYDKIVHANILAEPKQRPYYGYCEVPVYWSYDDYHLYNDSEVLSHLPLKAATCYL